MKHLRLLGLILFAAVSFTAAAERYVVDGVTYECSDGLCRIVDEEAKMSSATNAAPDNVNTARVLQGYVTSRKFISFLKGEVDSQDKLDGIMTGSLIWLGILAILIGGFVMNLTPCVLPMIPVNLMIIGRSAARGVWYGLGMALAYGTLGVAAATGGLAFGTIQGNPWFNLCMAAIFIVLALAMAGAFVIDLSKPRTGIVQGARSWLPWLFAFFMGAVSAVLAGACVAPVLISVLLFTAKRYAEGHVAALGLPFLFGIGMALPWPFLGAGLKVLPKPGAWMKWVNRGFALLVFAFSIWYARLAWLGFAQMPQAGASSSEWRNASCESVGSKISEVRSKSSKPILVDCWATWCKNCAAMDAVLEKPEVREALEDFELIKLQAEDMRELKKLKGFESVRGLPAFVIFE